MATTPNTEAIDKLFLELSQFTQASTAKELELIRGVSEARATAMELYRQIQRCPGSPEWHHAFRLCSALTSRLDALMPIARKAP